MRPALRHVLGTLLGFGALHAFAVLLLVLLLVLLARRSAGRTSVRAEYERDVRAGLSRGGEVPLVHEAEVAALPPPVQRYLRYVGVVGQPRVRNYRLRFRGRIRSSAEARWMPFVANQHSFVDEPMRLFWMRATMLGAPVEAFHRLAGGHATMRVRALGAFTLVDASGPVMDRSEAVTLFNDMCILAPATLLEPSVVWEASDAHSARARFSNGDQTIRATLRFTDDGRLLDFVSDDRAQASADGKQFTPLRFSTPVSDYRAFGPFRIAARGEARWHAPSGEFTYGEFELVDLAYNVGDTTPAEAGMPRESRMRHGSTVVAGR